MHPLRKIFQKFEPVFGQAIGEETAAKETPEQLFDVVLRVLLNPSRWNGASVCYGLQSNQLAAAEFFKREHGEVIGDVRVPGLLHSTGRLKQRAGVLDASLHCCNYFVILLGWLPHQINKQP